MTSLLVWSGCGISLPNDVSTLMNDLPEELNYNVHVKPILSDRCFSCHGNDKNSLKANLRLDLEDVAFAELTNHPGKYAIVPDRISQSELVKRIISKDPDYHMPPPESNLNLSSREKAILVRWIDQGAKYLPHWSFIEPKDIEIPQVEDEAWTHNPIDHFVLDKLEEMGWSPASEAAKEMLVRRVTLDLTGLPPTEKEIDNYISDRDQNAYDKVVDRLLASPGYAERMSTEWMDISRFADTHGYTVDRYRDMSPWRDWVIQAFNENMRFDSFAIYQLAGDLLPDATAEQILATGFNRNHQQNMEGGIIDEEFRVEYVADRTNTLGAAFLGLTLECARCHDHKYDPISQKAYYQLFSFFNNVNEAGQIPWDDAVPTPTLPLINTATQELLNQLSDKIKSKESDLHKISENEKQNIAAWINQSPQINIPDPHQFLSAHFTLDNHLSNVVNPVQNGVMKQVNSGYLDSEFVDGIKGKGLILDGDAWLDLDQVGVFDKASRFTVALYVNIPSALKNGVIFHKGIGAALYNFRGFHLALKDNRLEVLMAHTSPDNAIIKYGEDLPRDEWIHLALSYDGSGIADGLKTFLDGKEITMELVVNNLYKDILFYVPDSQQPGLQIGARWRGSGIKGAVVDEIKVFNRDLTSLEINQLLIYPESDNSKQSPKDSELEKLYLSRYSISYQRTEDILESLRRKKYQIEDTIREVMVIKEMENPRQTFILERGQYSVYGEPVDPTVLEDLLSFPESLPRNRLGLATWLFHPNHPLTARVIVNRYWQMIFGKGIVDTPEDFGNQGSLPTHPELLDWLALDFVQSSWNIKRLLKQIVLSRTYRQSSMTSAEMMEKDPDNIWYARGPSNRLTAEMMRDQVLAASEMLDEKIGGESVKPYQPEGLWKMNGGNYKRTPKDLVHRRSLYTFLKRSVPHPTQQIFDGPSRSLCTVKRQKTSTPLQALVLLNDPVYLEAARALSYIMVESDSSKGIEVVFRRLTGRYPSKAEKEVLQSLYDHHVNNFRSNPEKTKSWLTIGDLPLDKQHIEDAILAANVVVASTIMNTDASTYKR